MTVTRADVARRAGVSPALVSYVLNGGPRPVSHEKRTRILAAINELGYRPDVVARQMRTGRSELVGLIVPDLRMPYFAEFTHVISECATKAGYQLVVGSSGWDLRSERVQIDGFAMRRVDGLILMSVDPTQVFEDIVPSSVRLLVIDRPEAAFRGAHLATQHLIEHGHTSIGHIGGPGDVVAAGRRSAGWRQAMIDADLVTPPEYQVKTTYDREGGYTAGKALLGLQVAPTAIFVDADTQASGLLRAAFELGVRVPGDLAVATADGTELTRYSVPSLTTVVYPVRELAAEALASVLHPDALPVRRLTNADYQLIRRESCACGVQTIEQRAETTPA